MSALQKSYEQPEVWVRRWLRVMSPRAGRVFGLPLASKPSSTIGFASWGRTVLMGVSSDSLPPSTFCLAQAQVSALVIEAIQTTVAAVIGSPEGRARLP